MPICRFRFVGSNLVEKIELPARTTVLFLRQTMDLGKFDLLKVDNVILKSSQTLADFKDRHIIDIEIHPGSVGKANSDCSNQSFGLFKDSLFSGNSGSEGSEKNIRVVLENGERFIKSMEKIITPASLRRKLNLSQTGFEITHSGRIIKEEDNICDLPGEEVTVHVSKIQETPQKICIIVDLFGDVKKFRIYPRVSIGKLRKALDLKDSATFKHSGRELDDDTIIGTLKKEEGYIVLVASTKGTYLGVTPGYSSDCESQSTPEETSSTPDVERDFSFEEEGISIFARMRPSLPGETGEMICENSDNEIKLNLERKDVICHFNHVFDETSSNMYIWKAICLPQIRSSTYRTNLHLCYGATASGKTFTMLGSKFIETPRAGDNAEANSDGLIPLTLYELLRRPAVHSITLSALEAYGVHSSQVKIYDLLADDNILNMEFSKKISVSRTQLVNRTCIDIEEESDVETVLKTARGASHCARTINNPSSNRGHVLFFIRYVQSGHQKQFIFCDLAGSEGESSLKGLNKIEAEKYVKLRRMEAGVIKMGLTELNSIFDKGYTPAKGQGLRLLLHPYLTWDTKISLCVTISQSIDHKMETTSTFRFVRSTQMCKLESLFVDAGEEVERAICKRCSQYEVERRELDYYREHWKQSGDNQLERQKLQMTKEKMNEVWLSIVEKRNKLEEERLRFEEEKRIFEDEKQRFLEQHTNFKQSHKI